MEKMRLKINDLEVTWDESKRRVERPCVKCQQPTKGRMKGIGGLADPAHVTCAIDSLMKKVLHVYGRRTNG